MKAIASKRNRVHNPYKPALLLRSDMIIQNTRTDVPGCIKGNDASFQNKVQVALSLLNNDNK